MAGKPKKVEIVKVEHRRNVELGIEPECHECISHFKDKTGYPQCGKEGFTRMSRWIYWKETGDKPEVVMHLCDNPACININHLKGGTTKENVQDAVSKNRNVKGELVGTHKLTEEEVIKIKEMISSGAGTTYISRWFNVNKSTICDIKYMRTWKHLSEAI
jgi:hypothetical protein